MTNWPHGKNYKALSGKNRCPQCGGMLSVEHSHGVSYPIYKVEDGRLETVYGIGYAHAENYKCRACKIQWQTVNKLPDNTLVVNGLWTRPRPYEEPKHERGYVVADLANG